MAKKWIFLGAFFMALFIFIIGLLFGVSFENLRAQNLQNIYFDSETSLLDSQLSSELIYSSNLSCDEINEQTILFADRIYSEAEKLEKYDNSNKITNEIVYIHRRYDLLRTMLWKDIISNKVKCPKKINTVVYFYQYRDPSITLKATQDAMANFLNELKIKYGDKIILIPIAVDTDIESLKILMEGYNIETTPYIFINEKIRLTDLTQLRDFNDSIFATNTKNKIV